MTAAADTRTIHERMVAILTDLPPIGKDQKNVQQNFMFRGHDDVLNALNPLFAKHGVFVTPTVLGRETTQRTTAKGSTMFEVSLLVEYSFHGLAGDIVRASSWGEGTDMGDKATSKAMTMAFKSVLNQAFAISNKEIADPDRHTPDESRSQISEKKNETGTSAPTQSAPPETDALMQRLIALSVEYKALVPDFDVTVIRTKATKHIGKPGYKEWLEKQIVLLEGHIREKQPSGFEIPVGAKA